MDISNMKDPMAIYRSDVQEFLEAAGVSDEEITRIMYKALKEYAMTVLKDFAEMIDNGAYDVAMQYLKYSPAGDGWGEDSHYIPFKVGAENMDFHEVLSALMELRKKVNGF